MLEPTIWIVYALIAITAYIIITQLFKRPKLEHKGLPIHKSILINKHGTWIVDKLKRTSEEGVKLLLIDSSGNYDIKRYTQDQLELKNWWQVLVGISRPVWQVKEDAPKQAVNKEKDPNLEVYRDHKTRIEEEAKEFVLEVLGRTKAKEEPTGEIMP